MDLQSQPQSLYLSLLLSVMLPLYRLLLSFYIEIILKLNESLLVKGGNHASKNK